MLQIINQFKGKRIAVIGDVMLDRYIHGKVERISPEAPIPIVEETDEFERLGGAANVMLNIAKMRGQAFAFGVIGEDTAGQELRKMLLQEGIDTCGILSDAVRRTTVKTRIMAGTQQLLRLDQENKSGLPISLQEQLYSILNNMLKANKLDVIVLEDYGKGVLNTDFAQRIVNMSNHHSIPILLDPTSSNPLYLQNLTILKPNRKEAYSLAGMQEKTGSQEELRDVIDCIRSKMIVRNIVVTLAQNGMLLSDDKGHLRHIPTTAKEVFDVSGAGDTVISAISLAVAVGATMEEATTIGNYAASVAVGKLGTSPVSADEIIAICKEHC